MNNSEILHDLKNLLVARFGGNIDDVILFGSQLTERKVESDYDILIIVKDRYDWKLERQISDICYEIDLKYGIITDTHVLCRDDLDSPRGKQPVFENAISNGLHV